MTNERLQHLLKIARTDEWHLELLGSDIRQIIGEAMRARARVAELEAQLSEREQDMHIRIRQGYDNAVANAWRAKVSELEAENARLRKSQSRLREIIASQRVMLNASQRLVCSFILWWRHWLPSDPVTRLSAAAAHALGGDVARAERELYPGRDVQYLLHHPAPGFTCLDEPDIMEER